MKINGILIDLDGTLVDTSNLDAMRKNRNWKGCVANLNRTFIYDGILEFLKQMNSENISIGIVTTSVSFYAEAVLRYHKILYHNLVAYHDVQRRKPAPDAYLKAAKNLALAPDTIIGIGDTIEDVLSIKAAKFLAIGAGWSKSFQQHDAWDHIVSHPSQLLSLCYH